MFLLRSRVERTVTFAAMRLRLGGTFVKCTACQGEDFYPAFPLTADRREVMVCARCENQAVFGELIGKPEARAHAAKMPWATEATPAKPGSSRRSRSG
jgi:hypothetical protein